MMASLIERGLQIITIDWSLSGILFHRQNGFKLKLVGLQGCILTQSRKHSVILFANLSLFFYVILIIFFVKTILKELFIYSYSSYFYFKYSQ